MVSETPDQPRPAAVTGTHIREGCSAAPMVVAVKKKKRKTQGAAAAKTVGGGDGLTTTDSLSGSTESTVMLESWSDVDDQAESGDDMQVDAADGAKSTVGRMQVVAEAIDETTDLLEDEVAGVLPPFGGVQKG